MRGYLQNEGLLYVADERVKRNVFLNKKADDGNLPIFEKVRGKLPVPVWEGHESAINCYFKAWQIAFGNLRKANVTAGFVSDYIDTAFNGNLFMWDSSFIVMFGKYGARAFDFQKTLDNFYSHQHKDGFICREILENQPGDQWARDDPASTGPNVLPWAEWEYYLFSGDKERLKKVFDPLCAYHNWLRLHRSWQDGSYFSCGWACGMDNIPRQQAGYNEEASHGFMSWIDTCAQQYLSADLLIKIGAEIGRESETEELKQERTRLKKIINGKMWNAKMSFYCDKFRDGSLSNVKTVGSYWTLLAGIVPKNRVEKFIAHLQNENEFKRRTPIPALSADSPAYQSDGGYWRGGVWDEIFDGIHDVVDACAFQDGHIDYDELDAFFTVNKKLADKYGMQCWTNAESFDRDMPIKFLPIKFDKLRMKLEAAKRAGYDKAITFEFSHFMSPRH